MAITLTSTGPNSARVDWVNGDQGTNMLNLITQVWNWIGSHGWTLHKQYDTYSRVYKAPNRDGVTFKYMFLGGVAAGIRLRLFETWDVTTNATTNECVYSSGNHMRTHVTGSLYLFATDKWFIHVSSLSNGNYGDSVQETWTGCIEFTKAVEDTAPSYCWTTGHQLSGGYRDTYYTPRNCTSSAGSYQGSNWASLLVAKYASPTDDWGFNRAGYYGAAALPRDTLGRTSTNAEKYTHVYYPEFQNEDSVEFYYGINSGAIGGDFIPYREDGTRESGGLVLLGDAANINTIRIPATKFIPMATGTPYAYTPWIAEMKQGSGYPWEISTINRIRGKMYGIKVLSQGLGSDGDTVNIPCDADYLMSEGGTLVEHLIVREKSGSNFKFAIPL
jgi:hypothetical protein